MFWKLLRKSGKAWALALLIIAAFAAVLIDSAVATADSLVESPIQGALLPDDAAAASARYGGEVAAVAIDWEMLPEVPAESAPSLPPPDHPRALSESGGAKGQLSANPAVALSPATVGTDSAATASPAPALLNDFQTIQDTGSIPADPNGAVGPAHVGVIVNSSVEFYTKTGTVVRASTLSSWFSAVSPPASPFDPKIVYDHHAGRWLIVALSYSTSPQASSFLVSASQSSDPTGGWWIWNIDAMTGVSPASWADYPGVGFNNTAVYISANMLAFSDGFQGTKIVCLSSAQLYSGSSLSVYYWYDDPALQDADGSGAFTVQPVHTFGSPSQQYFVNSKRAGGSVVTIRRTPRQFPPGDLYRAATLSTQSYSAPPDAVQQGGSGRIDTVDSRIFGAQYRDGYIYTAITSGHTWPNGSFRAAVLYWKIAAAEPNYSLVTDYLWGDGDYDYYFPMVYSDSQGNVTMVFNRSGSTEYAGIRYTSWTTGDSGWRASRQLKAGEAYYVRKDSYGRNRWGDYNGIAADPVSPDRIFIFSKYAKANNQWGTWVGELTAVPVTYTIATSPSGLRVEVDGTSYTAPASFNWVVGSAHTLNVPSPQSGGTGIRHVYASWSDGGAQSHTTTVGAANATITASFKTQYQLTMATNQGTTSPSAGTYWYDAGSSVPISATAPSAGTGERYVWNGWTGSGTGSYTSADNPATITMNSPITQTASWNHQYQLTIATSGLSSSYPATITVVQNEVTNSPTAYATWSDWADIGSTLTIANPVTVSATERYHSLDTTSWTVDSAIAATVSYGHQFLVTIATSGLSGDYPATITAIQDGARNNPTTSTAWSDWVDADSTLTVTSSVQGGWFGQSWSTDDTTSWNVNSAISAVVEYQRDYTMIYIIAGIAAAVVITLVFTIFTIRRRKAKV